MVSVDHLIDPELPSSYSDEHLPAFASCLYNATLHHKPRIFFLGGHVIKSGCTKILVSMLRKGWISHIACNGSVMIHDFELCTHGATSEDVQKYITEGQFGLWTDTGVLNDIINSGTGGMGERVGKFLVDSLDEEAIANSVFATAYQLGVPVTVHPLIGGDIIHAHPNFDGRETGEAAHTDFLIFADSVSKLEGGVFANVGSAVHGPEVYLKTLSMARNVSGDLTPNHFTTAVFDIVKLPSTWRDEIPAWNDPLAYFRPWKTILIRTVHDGGRSFYFEGVHSDTLLTLHEVLGKLSNSLPYYN